MNLDNRNKPASRPAFLARHIPLLSALAALVFIGLWMLSGSFIVGGDGTDGAPPLLASGQTAEAPKPKFRVSARRFRATRRNDVLHIRARTEADKSVEVRAETAGRVETISEQKGRAVVAGTVLCKLDEGYRKATLAGARAQLAQTKADFEASTKLSRSGFAADLNVSAKRAAYEAAGAALEQAELDLANTAIKAPFDGIIDDQPAKVGDFLAVGGTCARLVALDPLLVVGDVAERDIGRLKVGRPGRATLVTGQTANGRVRFIAPSAAVATHTFRVELEVANRDASMRNGVTADVHIPLEPIDGHRLSAGLLTLADDGTIGVRAIETGDRVRFLPVRLLDQSAEGAFVGGLPAEVTIITAGQDYVVDGQQVEVELEQEAGDDRS